MSSPRPTYEAPTLIPRKAAAHHVWGDEQAGRVDDFIYVSSEGIHQIVFGMTPGTWFRHSREHLTVFGADEVYVVLAGVLWLSNPETGEMHRLRAGEAAFFRKDTWHHGLAEGPEPLLVLEYMSPPPRKGTSQAYAKTRPYLETPRYTQDEWIGRWPMAAAEARARFTMTVLRDAEVLWRAEGDGGQALVGLLAATEHLTAGTVRLLPGTSSAPRRHGGDMALHGLRGALEIEAPLGPQARSSVVGPGDGYFVPAGSDYRLHNCGAEVAEAHFGVGGSYLPGRGVP